MTLHIYWRTEGHQSYSGPRKIQLFCYHGPFPDQGPGTGPRRRAGPEASTGLSGILRQPTTPALHQQHTQISLLHN